MNTPQHKLEPMSDALQSEDVDAIILNYRVGALAAQAARSAKENGVNTILVVDNHSEDDSLSILKRDIYAFAEVLQLPENVGFSSGNNAGSKCCKKPLILFMNPDVSLDPGALHQMIQVMNANPLASVVCPALYGPDGEAQASAYLLLSPFRILNMLLGLDKLHQRTRWSLFAGNADLKHNGDYTGIVESAYGACMLVRRSAFNAVAGFDEDFFLYCEETDLCLRLQMAGWKIYRSGEAKVKHWHGQSAKQVARKSTILMNESHKLYAAKHFSFLGRMITLLAFVVGFSFRTLLARSIKAKANYFAALGVWLGWTRSIDPRQR